MSNIPDYGNIGGDPLTNDGKHYKIWVAPASDGTPGVWHVYYNGDKVFVRSPAAPAPAPTAWGGGMPNSIADSAGVALAAPAPAPAPAPTAPAPASAAPPADPQTGGVAAPVATAMPVASAPQPASVNPLADTPATPTNTNQYPDSQAIDHIAPIDLPAGSIQGTDGTSTSPSSPLPSNITDANDSTDGHQLDSLASSIAPADSPSAQAAEVSSNAVAMGNSYTVVKGDTMWDIAQRNNMSLQQLEALNPQIENPSLIHPGEQVNLGDAGAATVPSPENASFPATSSYDTTTTQPQTAEPQKVSLGGWSDGTSAVPSDPVNGVASVPPVQTDPLKINHDNHNA